MHLSLMTMIWPDCGSNKSLIRLAFITANVTGDKKRTISPLPVYIMPFIFPYVMLRSILAPLYMEDSLFVSVNNLLICAY